MTYRFESTQIRKLRPIAQRSPIKPTHVMSVSKPVKVTQALRLSERSIVETIRFDER